MRPPSRSEPDRGLEVLTADVVEVDVDAVGRRLAQLLRDRAVLVVERRVEPEVLDDVAHLLGRAGAADDPARAERLGDLADRAAHGAGRARHEDDVAGLDLRDAGQADVRREPGHPEHAEVGGCRCDRHVDDPRAAWRRPRRPRANRSRAARGHPRRTRQRATPRRHRRLRRSSPRRPRRARRTTWRRSSGRACRGRPTSRRCAPGAARRRARAARSRRPRSHRGSATRRGAMRGAPRAGQWCRCCGWARWCCRS